MIKINNQQRRDFPLNKGTDKIDYYNTPSASAKIVFEEQKILLIDQFQLCCLQKLVRTP